MATQAPPTSPLPAVDERYELLGRIGQGAFAIVYQARQRSTGQMVALKVLRRSWERDTVEGPEVISRFQREMLLLGQLRHPGIVRLIDAGTLEDGRLFIATELLEGNTLKAVIEAEGPIAPAELRHLMLQLLDALCAAQARGLVHRDIKPANIMISPGGVRRNATLLDLGVAGLTDGKRVEGYQALTRSGMVLGTPAYFAPELLNGAPASPATDLFAWGLMYLEALTGAPPWPGRSLAEIVSALMSPEPVRLPDVLVGTELGALLRRVVEKDPDLRVQAAREVFLALERCPADLQPRGTSAPARPTMIIAERPISVKAPPAWCFGLVVAVEPDGEGDDPPADFLHELRFGALALVSEVGGTLRLSSADSVEIALGPTASHGVAVGAALNAVGALRKRVVERARNSGAVFVMRAALHGVAADTPDGALAVARRLAGGARVDELLISEPTRAYVPASVVMEPGEARVVSGEAEPVPVFSVAI